MTALSTIRLSRECPEDIDGILTTVKSILATDGVTSISIKQGEAITYERTIRSDQEMPAEQSTESFSDLRLYDIVRNVRMEEFQPSDYKDEPCNPQEYVLLAFVHAEQDHWVVTNILTHPATKLWKWIGIPKVVKRNLTTFMGAKIEEDENVPEDTFILCCAETKLAMISEIKKTIKCTVG